MWQYGQDMQCRNCGAGHTWDNGKSRTDVELKSDNPQSIRENGSRYRTMQDLDQHTRNQQQLSGKNGQ
jgi:hypothetical protein